ncbi:WD40/YVTN/BNR-like repeat-containing protein [Flexivirga lutea]
MSDTAIHLLVGTTKGAFILDGAGDRTRWTVRGPYCDGWPINHVIGDAASGTLWAGGGGDWTGAGVWRSRDSGHAWEPAKLTTGQMDAWAATDPGFAASIGWTETPMPFGDGFSQVWSLGRGGGGGRLYAGTKPATLLVSDDDGETWQTVKGLTDHPSAPDWGPGAAGLVLHTIVVDPENPEKMWVGISAAGVFATEDGGVTWERRNDLADAADGEGNTHPAAGSDGHTGFCVHHLEHAHGDRLYQQNHHGVWRSDDGGLHWHNITTGLPSTFGFPLWTHPRDAQTVWTVPLNGDSEGRYPPDAAAAVWRSRDAGATWQALRSGLPQEACFFTVLRQGMTGDRHDPAGVYFGTNTGSVFASRDEGDTWTEIARHLPTVLAVEVLEPTTD